MGVLRHTLFIFRLPFTAVLRYLKSVRLFKKKKNYFCRCTNLLKQPMKRINLTALLLALLYLGAFSQDEKMIGFINDLMSKMTVDEKIGQLNLVTSGGFTTGTAINENEAQKLRTGQIGGMFNVFSMQSMKAAQDIAVKESNTRIPIIFGRDVIHGFSTIFPIPLALSCTWDMALIEKSARIAAQEATANGVSWTFSPMVDIARDPRWGRIAEGSGEDPWLGSQIAAAMVKGYQGENLSLNNTMLACVKHFALYGAGEAGRDYNTVDMSRIAMYNEWLPPYKAAVDAGVGSVMTSFNLIDGIPATGNRWLLTELLREEWGFNGFVVTDYTATNEMINHGMGDLQKVSALAVKAGTDMDMVGEGFITTLKNSITEGKINLQDIDMACRRVLEAKYKLGLFEDPYRYIDEERSKSDVLTEENIRAARDMAVRSIVLLKNDNQILPLKKSGTIAVVGPLADSKGDMLGTWALGGNPQYISTVLEGLKNVGGKDVTVLYAKGSETSDNPMLLGASSPLSLQGEQQTLYSNESEQKLLDEALQIAKKADVVIAVVGEPASWSGEAASMTDIGLQKVQQNLLKAMLSTGKPVILVLINGRPMTLGWENSNVNAIVEAWAGGLQTGNAVADVLFGNYNPSGKLTTTFPLNVGQIPLYYNQKNTGRPMDPNNKFTSKYLDSPNEPLYPFGFGLSYTTFEYGDINLNKTQLKGNETLIIKTSVANTGKFAGEEVVQLYIRDMVGSVSRPIKELKDFRKIMLQPGEQKVVTFEVTTGDLEFYNSKLELDWESGDFEVYTGTNSRDLKSAAFNWVK
jgi:beta-glucosidase